MRILVAEDDPVCRRLVEAFLTRSGYEAVLARDGDEAWAALCAPDAPSLAILDWMMPGVDGLELCRRVRERGTSAYIIMLTAKTSRQDVLAGLGAGADDYVMKPFDLDELRARIRVGERIVGLQQTLNVRISQLRDSEAITRAIVEGSHDAFILVDRQDVIRDVNSAAERMFGCARRDLVGTVLQELIVPGMSRQTYQQELARLLDGGAAGRDVELSALRRGGEPVPVELSMVSIGAPGSLLVSVVVRELSERRRLEIERRHAQKLEAVGQLAAGIAHEINTPVQFIGDNTRFLADGFQSLLGVVKKYQVLRDAETAAGPASPLLAEIAQAEQEADLAYLDAEIPKAISQTLEGVTRVATIVRAMKDFAHPTATEKSPVDLNRALVSTITVARNELKYVADVETELGELPPVTCCIGDLNQVFLNLLINAAHAVADVVKGSGQKGRITVRTAHEGEDVLVAISDTGGGIPEHVRTRIFDPFFTTKEVGRGTGQGLSIARTIVVQKHGGSLAFETEVGRGTTFFVRLPVEGHTGGEAAAA